MTFWERIQKLCADKHTTPTALCKSLGLSTSMATRWKNGTIPNSSTMCVLAEALGVTAHYLMWGSDNPTEKAPDVKPNAIFLDRNMIYEIPIYETVSAGFGALANDEIVDYTPLYFTDPGEAAETICIKVKGDSMYPKIEDGDIIQVRKQDAVDSGTIAVVLLDGDEGLVKRVLYGDGWLELHSINPYYKPMRFTGADIKRVRVVGVVRKLIKNF